MLVQLLADVHSHGVQGLKHYVLVDNWDNFGKGQEIVGQRHSIFAGFLFS